ncbi:MAG: hypothetical protein ACRCTI_12480, partial [Beijerinckiaceae bacterium]
MTSFLTAQAKPFPRLLIQRLTSVRLVEVRREPAGSRGKLRRSLGIGEVFRSLASDELDDGQGGAFAFDTPPAPVLPKVGFFGDLFALTLFAATLDSAGAARQLFAPSALTAVIVGDAALAAQLGALLAGALSEDVLAALAGVLELPPDTVLPGRETALPAAAGDGNRRSQGLCDLVAARLGAGEPVLAIVAALDDLG